MTKDDLDMTDLLYRAGEHASIKALLADREEATVYLKVEALQADYERLREAVAGKIAQWRYEFTQRRQRDLIDDDGWITGTGMLKELTDELKAALEKATSIDARPTPLAEGKADGSAPDLSSSSSVPSGRSPR